MVNGTIQTPDESSNEGMGKPSLAPAIRRRGLLPPAMFENAIKRLGDCLNAEKVVRANGANEDGRQAYQVVLDYPVIIQAVKLALELETGKAPQTLEISATEGGRALPTTEDAITMLNANPKLAARIFGSYLENVKKAVKSAATDVYDASTGQLPESQSGGSQSGKGQSYQKPTK